MVNCQKDKIVLTGCMNEPDRIGMWLLSKRDMPLK